MSSDKKKFRIIQIDGYNDSSSRLIDINDSGLIVDKQGGIYLGNASNDASAYPVKVAISEGDLLNYASIEQLTEVEEGIADSIETLENQISDVSSNLDKYLIDPKGTSNQIIKGDGTLMDISSIGGGEDNVQADWNETNTSSDAYIKNKPTLYNGTVTSVTPGTGLIGTSSDTAITTTGTINLKPAQTGEIGGIKVGKDNANYTIATNTSPTINANVTTAGKYYAVEIDKNDKAYVYVPWTDTNDDTDTWRAIKVNGTQKLSSNSSTALDICASSNISLSWNSTYSKLYISATDTDTNYYHTPSHTSGLKIATGSGRSDMYVPYATTSAFGVIKVGNGLSISSGVLSADGGTDTYHSPSSTSGLKIATGSGVSDMYVPYATATTYGVMKTPPVATSSTVGLVKIGDGISVTADGTISVSSSGGSSTDTKNTAGSSKSTSTLYLVGATSFSSTGVQTYCSSTAVYMTNGKLYASSFYETSDERLKTFKSDVEIDFDKLAKIPKKEFIWNNDEDAKSNIGTSAQAIQELYPELVSETDDGYLTVDYAKLSIIALAAIDKLNKRIEELESKIK